MAKAKSTAKGKAADGDKDDGEPATNPGLDSMDWAIWICPAFLVQFVDQSADFWTIQYGIKMIKDV